LIWLEDYTPTKHKIRKSTLCRPIMTLYKELFTIGKHGLKSKVIEIYLIEYYQNVTKVSDIYKIYNS
jgi:hypothetical protein